jgi:hypothetical protein
MLFLFVILIHLIQVVPVFGRLSTTTREACVTYWGKKPPRNVPSRTWTKRYTITITRPTVVFHTTTRTRTPSAVIRTDYRNVAITTTRTAPQQTDTATTITSFQVTSTFTTTNTIAATTTVTANYTVPYPEITTTISTSAGFLPIRSDPANYPASTSAGTTPIQIAAANEENGRTIDPSQWARPTSQSQLNDRRDYGQGGYRDDHGRFGKRYPTSVACEKYVKAYTSSLYTKTATKITIKYAKTPTRRVTLTVTRISEVVKIPYDASSTLTRSTTITALISTTISETSTTTSTSTQSFTAAPTPTVYPGCGADNFLSYYGSRAIVDAYYIRDGSQWNYDDNTPDSAGCCQMYVPTFFLSKAQNHTGWLLTHTAVNKGDVLGSSSSAAPDARTCL